MQDRKTHTLRETPSSRKRHTVLRPRHKHTTHTHTHTHTNTEGVKHKQGEQEHTHTMRETQKNGERDRNWERYKSKGWDRNTDTLRHSNLEGLTPWDRHPHPRRDTLSLDWNIHTHTLRQRNVNNRNEPHTHTLRETYMHREKDTHGERDKCT